MQSAEKDEPSGTEAAGGNYSAREQIRVRKMQIVNKDISVSRLAKWLLLNHSNPGLSPLNFTCHSGMQYKNVCSFIMLHACTAYIINLLQTIKVVPCTNCLVCLDDQRGSWDFETRWFSLDEKSKIYKFRLFSPCLIPSQYVYKAFLLLMKRESLKNTPADSSRSLTFAHWCSNLNISFFSFFHCCCCLFP